LAFALRAALEYKAGSLGLGSPLAERFKDGLSAAFGVGLRPGLAPVEKACRCGMRRPATTTSAFLVSPTGS
ncbi:MAG: hypothetical protein ACO3NZ_11860, partial [Pirellulales bacterium]